MKTSIKIILTAALVGFAWVGFAQQNRTLQFDRTPGQDGLNVFETPKEDTVEFDGLKIRVGGDFAFQFQGLNQSNTSTADTLVDLGSNFNLPTANLNIDGQLYDGVRVHLGLYLSSLHHEETWVKGGYLQIDKLDFIKEGFLEGLMNVATIRVGLDEINYGDAHFRRTDNARAIYNPFVGNYLMDAFTTEAFGEVNIQKSGFIGVLGLSNGKLNQSVIVTSASDNKPAFFGKLGYDSQINDDFRLRLTGSWYMSQGKSVGGYLYGGDRTEARYYDVMRTVNDGVSPFNARINPRFKQLTSFQVNPFIKFKGLEIFGIYEVASNNADSGGGSLTQIAAEALYRFGSREQLYIGGRYNSVSGKYSDASTTDLSVNRINIGGGWFLTKNIIAKVEYVKQNYGDNGEKGSKYIGGEFSGLNIEAAISF